MNKCKIRPATSRDFPSIQKLLAECSLPTAGVKENLARFLVADYDGVVGVIGWEQEDTSALLRSLAVSVIHRRAGIAAALVEQALGQLRVAGAEEVFLLTNKAEKYMQNFGFSKIHRSVLPALLMQKSALESACPLCSSCMKLDLL